MVAGFALVAALLVGTASILYPLVHRLRRARRLAGWLLLLGLMACGVAASLRWEAWPRLLATWAATFLGFKALLLLHHPPEELAGLTWWRYAGFVGGWLGMDLGPWIRPREAIPMDLSMARLRDGAALTLIGLALMAGALALPLAALPGVSLARDGGALAGLVIAALFGATRVLAGIWNVLGRPVGPLFDRPVYAASLADWWGKRWNLAVHAVLAAAIWQPLRPRIGAAWAAVAVFLASGLLHEYLLGYPAGGGWGGPTAYFAIQAAGAAIERRLRLPSDWRRPLWVLGITLLPSPLLFHPPLLRALFG